MWLWIQEQLTSTAVTWDCVLVWWIAAQNFLDRSCGAASGDSGLMGIVTAAAGRRDGYQIPVALAEAGLCVSCGPVPS